MMSRFTTPKTIIATEVDSNHAVMCRSSNLLCHRHAATIVSPMSIIAGAYSPSTNSPVHGKGPSPIIRGNNTIASAAMYVTTRAQQPNTTTRLTRSTLLEKRQKSFFSVPHSGHDS